MTQPQLSITTNPTIGRVYKYPGSSLPAELGFREAKELLKEGKIAPSITNISNLLKKDFEYYNNKFILENFAETNSIHEAINSPTNTLNFYADRGTRIHAFIEEYLLSEEDPYFYDLPAYRALEKGDLPFLEGFFLFMKEHSHLAFVNVEASVYGETLYGKKYAGTSDFLAVNVWTGEKIAGDWKTGKTVRKESALQLAAVMKATHMTTDFETLHEKEEDKIGMLVHINEENYHTSKLQSVEESFKTFSFLREAYDFHINQETVLRKHNFSADEGEINE